MYAYLKDSLFVTDFSGLRNDCDFVTFSKSDYEVLICGVFICEVFICEVLVIKICNVFKALSIILASFVAIEFCEIEIMLFKRLYDAIFFFNSVFSFNLTFFN